MRTTLILKYILILLCLEPVLVCRAQEIGLDVNATVEYNVYEDVLQNAFFKSQTQYWGDADNVATQFLAIQTNIEWQVNDIYSTGHGMLINTQHVTIATNFNIGGTNSQILPFNVASQIRTNQIALTNMMGVLRSAGTSVTNLPANQTRFYKFSYEGEVVQPVLNVGTNLAGILGRTTFQFSHYPKMLAVMDWFFKISRTMFSIVLTYMGIVAIKESFEFAIKG